MQEEIDIFKNKLIQIGFFQGAIVLITFLIYPNESPIPILNNKFDSFGTNARAFSSSQIIYSDWLEGAALRTHGIMANATWAGGFSALVLLLILDEKKKKNSIYKRMFYQFSLLIAILVVYLSLSRSVLISLTISLMVLGFQHIQNHVPNRDFLHFINTTSLVLFLSTSVYLIVFVNISKTFQTINDSRAGSLNTRSDIYLETYRLIREHPLPVIGFGIKPEGEGLVASIATHSTILGLIFKGGILSLITYLVVYFVIARRLMQLREATDLSVIIFIFIWCILEDFDPGHLIPLILGLSLAKMGYQKNLKKAES
jgi:O-antigen ligase